MKMYDQECKLILDYAKAHVDDIDIVLSENTSFTVQILNQEIESFKHSKLRGLGIRISKNGKIGYSFSEDFSENVLLNLVNEAIENSLIIENDEKAIFANYPDVPMDFSIYNETLSQYDENDKIQFVKDMERYAYEADPRVKNVSMSTYGEYSTYYKVANSKGMNKDYLMNGAYAYTNVLVEEDGDRRSAVDFMNSRDFASFNAKAIALYAVNKALSLLGKHKIESGSYPVVFSNEMSSTLLGTFTEIFGADKVHEGRSLLKGKLNTQIANPNVSIIDHARDPRGFSSVPFDSEGCPTQRTVLIENGVLKSYLHNSITAEEDGVISTGNGSRSYKSSLSINPSNFMLQPGSYKKEDLLKSSDCLIEIISLAGMHSGANTTSGDFSLSAEGYLYEKGVRVGSLTPFTISGNFVDLLNKVEMIADDFEYDSSSVGSSSILVQSLNISS